MARIAYIVAPNADQWSIFRDGERGMSYATQEAAFEVAIAEASGDLRSGHEVVIEVRAAFAEPVDRRPNARL
jgi:hypothetical protein